jgi:hypothetical protein
MRSITGFRGSSHYLTALLRGVAAVVALVGFAAQSADAQQAGFGPTWEALVTPYGWFPWTGTTVNPSNPRFSSSSGTIDPSQLIDHLSWVPFMGSAEFRNGPLGITMDYLHAPVRAGFGTKNILFGGGTGGATIDTGSATFLYRAIAQPQQYLDVGLGVRVWGFGGSIALNEGLLPAFTVTSGGNTWADPLLAARYHRELGNGFGATAG